ncbi:putative sh3 domain-containing protein [Eutypa lata UCREL1]|uniref:Putative sh3 domain-containing protein n=1 Tax=Eutypa lata (strain UCR-EL1) TaxID=1287681 RepID=M7T5K4_EUTLA|nr:putative sh3 domain-containing protein [Eutypa lata UCREL1]
MGINNPLPSSMASECKKCGKILTSFIDPRQPLGPDKVIPPEILANAKGLAILTVIKAGFIGSARFAAGPVGRNAEAAGAASLKGVAGIFSYSKTKGLFAGVSLEGSGIVERRDANEKLYGHRFTAAQLLTGAVPSPPQAQPLMTVLNSRVFSGLGRHADATNTSMYNDVPIYDDRHDGVVWGDNHGGRNGSTDNGGFGRPTRASTWNDNVYEAPPRTGPAATTFDDIETHQHQARDRPASMSATGFLAEKTGPSRPAAPKPNFASKQALLKKSEAVALFNFDADQPGDLAFKKGEVITVLKKTESDNDWWTGMIGSRHGIFPSNYVRMKE